MPEGDWIEPPIRMNATDQIRAELIGAVRDGRFPVGSKLPSEGELAQRFHVSRPVIREALGSLRVLGLTNAQPGSGTFVVSSDVKLPLALGDISSEDLNEVRMCLEVPAARLAAVRRTDIDLAGLRRSAQLYADAEEPLDRVQEDVRFHLAVAKASRNVLLYRLIGELRSSLRDQSLAMAGITGRRQLSTTEHQHILDAIVSSNADEASDAMQAHLESVHGALEDL